MFNFLCRSLFTFLILCFSCVHGAKRANEIVNDIVKAQAIYQELLRFFEENKGNNKQAINFDPVRKLLGSNEALMHINAFRGGKTLLEAVDEYRQDLVKKKNDYIGGKQQEALIETYRKLVNIWTEIRDIVLGVELRATNGVCRGED